MAKVLVIDDEDDVRLVVGGVLRAAGYEILSAADGAQGLALLRDGGRDVQLVITDILMPEKEGLETIRDLKSEFPAIKVIAMSGGGKVVKSTSHFFTADELGAHAVLRKPFGPNELLDAVQAALAA